MTPALLAQGACDEKGRAAAPVTLRDSAGVAFLEAPGDARLQSTWTVAKSPELLIGEAQGGELLDQVRGGRLFADGSFVIANAGSHQLLYYSQNGVLERAVGREGSGPREFRSFDFLGVIGDSVWVGDRANLRLSVLDGAGEFIRSISLNALSDRGLVHPVGVFDDGSILLSITVPAAIEPGLSPNYRRLFVVHPDTSIADLGRFFRGESYWVPHQGTVADIGRPFAQQGLTAVHGGEWFYSGGKEYRVERHDITGRLRGLYSYPGEPRLVTRRDLDEYLGWIRAVRGESREQLLRRAPPPERLPSYAELLIGRDGTVWAAPHEGAKPPKCWHVFHRRPPRFATACLPEGFTPLDVVGASVLGVLRDENDVERIARYRLVK